MKAKAQSTLSKNTRDLLLVCADTLPLLVNGQHFLTKRSNEHLFKIRDLEKAVRLQRIQLWILLGLFGAFLIQIVLAN